MNENLKTCSLYSMTSSDVHYCYDSMITVYDKIPNGLEQTKIQFYIHASLGDKCGEWKQVRYIP